MGGGGRLRRTLRRDAAWISQRGLLAGLQGASRRGVRRRRRHARDQDPRDGQARGGAVDARRDAQLLSADGVVVADRVRPADVLRYVETGGARLSVIGLGTWQFGSTEWGYGREYANRIAGEIVHLALDLGVNVVDTAEIYGLGRSERIVGEAIRGRRAGVFLATKLFPIGFPFRAGARVRASLRRLGVDHVDLYQQHWPNPLFSPGLLMPRFRKLVEGGLVRHAGVSNHNLAQWQACERAFGGAIPGASSVKQFEENVAAADLLLTGDEIARLDTLSS